MQNKTVKSSRNTGLDILRMISMLAIVLLHLYHWGGVTQSIEIHTVNYYLVWILFGAAYIAVDVYVLISGYYLCEKEFSWKKLLSIVVQTAVFSLVCYFITHLNGNVSLTGIITNMFPVLLKKYWFVTIYVGMYCLSPFINILINAMNQKQHKKLIEACVVLFSITPTISFKTDTFAFGNGMGIVWFCVLYIIAGYIKKYGLEIRPIKIYAIMFLLLTGLSKIVMSEVSYITDIQAFQNRSKILFQYNSITVLLGAVSVFICFMRVKKRFPNGLSHFISYIASASFSVYLIHDNENIRPILWEFIDATQYNNSIVAIGYHLMIVVLIFIVCVAFGEILRVVSTKLTRAVIMLCEAGMNRK